MEIIVLSGISWNYLPTRKQNILSRFPKDWEILYFEPYKFKQSNYSISVFHKSNIQVSGIPFLKSIVSKSLFAKAYRFIVSITFIREFYGWLLAWHIANVARISGFRKPNLVIISNPYALPCAKKFKKLGAKVIYDANDAHAAFEGTLPFVKDNITELCQITDVIVCASASLETKILEDYKLSIGKTTTIGNGVDTSIFHPIIGKRSKTSKKVIFYSGAINERIDFHLIEKILVELPTTHSLVMVGPISRSVQEKVDYLREYDRGYGQFTIVPPVEQTHLAKMMCLADTCILPFKKSALTEVLNPNTMYEYLACGKPVIAMDVSGSMKSWANELVIFAKSHSEFIFSLFELTDHKFKDTLAKIKKRIKWAEENDWNIKMQEYKKLIEQVVNNRNMKI